MMQLEVILTNCFGGFRLGTVNQMPAAGDGFKPDSNGHGAQHLGENMGKPRWSPLKNGHLWTPLSFQGNWDLRSSSRLLPQLPEFKLLYFP